MPIFHPDNIDINAVKMHSSAEGKILNMLSNMPNDTYNWHIYYSYSFKERNNKSNIHNFNELDFLILAPNVGIFILEVKGGQIKISHDKIYSIDRYHSSYLIDPYNQGLKNYYGLKDLILSVNKNLKIDQYIGGTLVAFPDISSKPNIGFRSDNIDTFVYGMDIYQFIMDNCYNLSNRDDLPLPNNKIINEIVNILSGPDFIYNLSLKDYIESVNMHLNELSTEQLTIFRGLLDNPRCLIHGDVGTGKTILAEFLFKELVDKRKKRVIFFTFNRMVAGRIKKDLHQESCYSIVDYLSDEYERLIGPLPKFKGFNKKVEFLIDNSLLILSRIDINPFDYLIFDEINNINYQSDKLLTFIDSFIEGGIKNGGCYLFFDNDNLDNNSLYNDYCFDDYRYTKFSIIKNARNSDAVKSLMNELKYGFNHLKEINNPYYKEINDSNLIIKQIDELIKNKIEYHQITILFDLSTKRKDNKILNELKSYYDDILSRYNKHNNNQISYANVNSFSGLENDIIIYIHDSINIDLNKSVDAVARAKVLCFVFSVIK